jgi:hypothetical protein
MTQSSGSNGWSKAERGKTRGVRGLIPGGIPDGCKRGWRALVWAAEREIHECDGAGDGGGGGIGEGAVSGAAGDADFVQGVAAGGGARKARHNCYNQVCIGIHSEQRGCEG